MIVTGILISITMVALGGIVKYGKQYWLIAGYNTMPKEKQKNVDIAGLAGFMGNCSFGLGAFVLAGTLVSSLWYPNLFPAVILLFLGGIIFMVIRAQKFDKNKRSKQEGLVLIIALAFTALILGGIGGMLIYGHLSPGVEVKPEGIVISGMYGTTIPSEEITGISLENEIPKILTRNNGFNSGEVNKGHFTLDGLGRGRLYLESSKGPFICIFTKSGYIMINYKDPSRTEVLYQTISDANFN